MHKYSYRAECRSENNFYAEVNNVLTIINNVS